MRRRSRSGRPGSARGSDPLGALVQLENSFTVPAAPDEAWKVLLDVERVAPCMPGATLTGHDGDSFEGTVKVKVGPIAVQYRGTAEFAERDDAAHTVKI